MNRGLAGVTFALLSSTLYGITPFFVNQAYDAGADPFGLMTARYTIASAILLAVRVARLGWGGWPERGVAVRLFLLGAVGLYLNSVFVFQAMRRMDSGLLMVLFYFYPVVVMLLAWLLHDNRPDRVLWLCLPITIGGVALSASDVSGGEVLGVVFVVAGALIYALYSVLGSTIMPRSELLSGLWLVLTGAAASFTLVWLLDPPGLSTTMPAEPIAWLSALEIAVIGTVVAMGAFFAGMNRIGASKSAVIQTFEVLVTISLGIALLDESLTARQVVGATMILGGVIVLTRAEARRVDETGGAPSLKGHTEV